VNELVFLRGRPIRHGQVIGVGDTWPGDLLAYRQEWEPFIAAHVALWRRLNDLFEGTASAQQKCPPGVFDPSQIKNLTPALQSFCAALVLTRMRIDQTNASYGIPAQWNAWAGKSSAEVLAGAAAMLKWHQDVVARVGGPYTDELKQIAKTWGIDIQLPDVPSFDTQQSIIAQIEGAYVAAKGLLQIAGYSAAQTLAWAGSQAQAVTEGLTDTVKKIPKVVGALSNPWVWVSVAVIVAGGLIYVYVPRPRPRAMEK